MAETQISMIHGPAGTGKTWRIRAKLKKDPRFGKLCATTGIAAVNLGDGVGEGVSTLNSTLGYFDTDTLREALETRKLMRTLKSFLGEKKNIVVDEASMLCAEDFDLIITALDMVNAGVHEDIGEQPLGLILVGDFLQLPPVKGEYCFLSTNWPRVQVAKLSEIKRQTDPAFQALLQKAREAEGEIVGDQLKAFGCLKAAASAAEDITTIFSTNEEVDKWNDDRYAHLLKSKPKKGTIDSQSWGVKRTEWLKIPKSLPLAVGAYVMILSNDFDQGFANGDCGFVTELDIEKKVVAVQLRRGDVEVEVRRVYRANYQKETPQGFTEPKWLKKKAFVIREVERMEAEGETDETINGMDWTAEYDNYCMTETQKNRNARASANDPFFDVKARKWVIGEMIYCPLRLAYASTVHKSQGLTLDNVQVVLGRPGSKDEKFFRKPNMLYVALSRARTLEGLKVIGSAKQVELACNTSRKLLEWI